VHIIYLGYKSLATSDPNFLARHLVERESQAAAILSRERFHSSAVILSLSLMKQLSRLFALKLARQV